jgi:hypothetical protein
MVASLPAGLATAQQPGHRSGPTIKLIVAQKKIQVFQFGKFAYVDPGVYVGAFGSRLQFDVQRASYGKPIRITEIIHVPGVGVVARPLPSWVLLGWNGLARFLRLTITTVRGKALVSKVVPFCPNAGNPQRADPNSPPNSPFPFECASNPFELGIVEGIQRGWATDPIGGGYFFSGERFKLKRGYYIVRVNIMRGWRRLLDVSAADGTAIVHMHVVKLSQSCPPFCHHRRAGRSKTLPNLPAVPTMSSPPRSDLPDLIPLPSWGIGVQNIKLKNHPPTSYINFGATVWINGSARLDVEGFRSNGSPTMQAYQYFWHNGRVVGRAKAGTMGFDMAKGHNHWHFQQFAQYRLLNARKNLVVRSQKVGFCIAPTDPINLLLPHAAWSPFSTGFGGACGSPTALWVQEMLPVGWGDTYFQYLGGQAFDITHLPNGTYYIEIIANPEHRLYESNYGNDISLRKVIISGTPGHRTVRVPAVDGIDPER